MLTAHEHATVSELLESYTLSLDVHASTYGRNLPRLNTIQTQAQVLLQQPVRHHDRYVPKLTLPSLASLVLTCTLIAGSFGYLLAHHVQI